MLHCKCGKRFPLPALIADVAPFFMLPELFGWTKYLVGWRCRSCRVGEAAATAALNNQLNGNRADPDQGPVAAALRDGYLLGAERPSDHFCGFVLGENRYRSC